MKPWQALVATVTVCVLCWVVGKTIGRLIVMSYSDDQRLRRLENRVGELEEIAYHPAINKLTSPKNIVVRDNYFYVPTNERILFELSETTHVVLGRQFSTNGYTHQMLQPQSQDRDR